MKIKKEYSDRLIEYAKQYPDNMFCTVCPHRPAKMDKCINYKCTTFSDILETELPQSESNPQPEGGC